MAPVAECRPLTSLSELLKWTANKACHSPVKAQKASVALFDSNGDQVENSANSPRLMVCHDMKGNYNEDRFYSGADDPSAYVFYHWSKIDEFVYFSHNLITVPPCGWVEAAHTNGVSIYGTVITEGTAGHEACLELLRNKQSVDEAVERLVAVSKHHGLDGWLVDIQNRLDTHQVMMVRYLLMQLTGAMHAEIAHSRVIWYDSVARNGRLAFQNKLNEENENESDAADREFFALCDGIFLNYWWTPESMSSSKTRAGDRTRDVYVGVDVFGRGTRDGGGFNVVQPVAESRWLGLSTALFATGWTHEVTGGEHFSLAEDVLWSRLTPLVGVRGPASLPLNTSFCQGRGRKCYADGQVTSSAAWHRLTSQELQPTFLQRARPAELPLTDAHGRPVDTAFSLRVPAALGLPAHDALPEPMLSRTTEQRRIELICSTGLELSQPGWQVYHTDEDGFNGGGCLAVINDSGKAGVFRLFACDLSLGPEQLELSAMYAVKSSGSVAETSAICLDVVESNRPGISRRVLEPAAAVEINSGLMDSCDRLLVSMPLEKESPMATTGTTTSGPKADQWETRCYLLPLRGDGQTCRVVAVGVYLTAGSSLLLGRLVLGQPASSEGTSAS